MRCVVTANSDSIHVGTPTPNNRLKEGSLYKTVGALGAFYSDGKAGETLILVGILDVPPSTSVSKNGRQRATRVAGNLNGCCFFIS